MANDRIVLVEEMGAADATVMIKNLPAQTPKKNCHKFVFTDDRKFIIGIADGGNPGHRELAHSQKVLMAGYIRFTFDENGRICEAYLNNRCKDFHHPPFEKLKEPQILITKIFGPISIDMEDIPKPAITNINLASSRVH